MNHVSEVAKQAAVASGVGQQFTVGSAGIWTLVALFLIALVKVWPSMKQRANEARKIESDEDASLRADLLKRIADLEAQLVAERQRCAADMGEIRGQLNGVVRQFVTFQLAVAQAIPPAAMTPEMIRALGALHDAAAGGGSGAHEPQA